MVFIPRNAPPPPPRVVAVDVDQTLSLGGSVNEKLVAWLQIKKQEGFYLMLWSSRGEDHAKAKASEFGLLELFDLICSKPGYIVDDQGWGWTKYTRVVPMSSL